MTVKLIKLEKVYTPDYLYELYDSVISTQDISDYVIYFDKNDDIQLDKRLEFDGVFNFAVGNTKILLKKDTITNTEFTQANFKRYEYQVKLIDENTDEYFFFGFIDKEASMLDKYEEYFEIVLIDVWSVYYNKIKDLPIPAVTTASIGNFFLEVLSDHLPSLSSAARISIGSMNASWDQDDYDDRVAAPTTIGMMIREIQKYYCAYIFVDDDRNFTIGQINIVNRQSFTDYPAADITNLILSGKIEEKYYEHLDYDGVLAYWQIEIEPGVWAGGWKYLWIDQEENEHLIEIYADSDIPSGKKYLNLKQEWFDPGVWGTQKVFALREVGDVLNDYKTLLIPPLILKVVVNGRGYRLLQKVTISSVEYQVYEIREYIRQYKTELTLKKFQ